MKDPHDKFQIAGICVCMAALMFLCYVWLVRYQCLPEPDWFTKIKGPSYPTHLKP